MKPLEFLLAISSTIFLLFPSTQTFALSVVVIIVHFVFQPRGRKANWIFYGVIALQGLQFYTYHPPTSGTFNWVIRIAFFLVFAVVQAVGYFFTVLTLIPTYPETAGPYRIGFKSILVPNKANGHPIPVEVMFPTALKNSSSMFKTKRVQVYPHAAQAAKSISRYTGMHWVMFEHWGAAELEYDALEKIAEVAPEGKKHPIVVFSHGLCGDPATYSIVRRELTSQGFVVLAPTHNDGSASIIRYIDGSHRGVELEKDDPKRVAVNWRREQVAHRVQEINRIMDYVRHEAEVDALFQSRESCLDFEKVGVMGHSFGAATSIESAYANKIFKCVVDLDGWMFPIRPEVINGGLDVPFAVLMTEHFTYLHDVMDPQITLFNGSFHPANLMGVVFGTRHIDFSDTPYYYHKFTSDMNKKTLTKSLDPRVALKYSTDLSVWFMKKHLKYEDDSLPEEPQFLEKYLDDNVRVLKNGLALKDLRKKVMCKCCKPEEVRP
jgi:dienelactone hydrolase